MIVFCLKNRIEKFWTVVEFGCFVVLNMIIIFKKTVVADMHEDIGQGREQDNFCAKKRYAQQELDNKNNIKTHEIIQSFGGQIKRARVFIGRVVMNKNMGI